jgi:hypothetical protein
MASRPGVLIAMRFRKLRTYVKKSGAQMKHDVVVFASQRDGSRDRSPNEYSGERATD